LSHIALCLNSRDKEGKREKFTKIQEKKEKTNTRIKEKFQSAV